MTKLDFEAFSKDWYWIEAIGFINLVAIPFYLYCAYGIKNVQSH